MFPNDKESFHDKDSHYDKNSQDANFLIQEANQGPLHKTIFKEPLIFENGFITPPKGPGLGIEFDQAVLKAHLVE